jgi:hypothetical protein
MGGKGKKKTRFKRLNGARSNRHVSYSPAFGSEVRLTCILSQISRDTKNRRHARLGKLENSGILGKVIAGLCVHVASTTRNHISKGTL